MLRSRVLAAKLRAGPRVRGLGRGPGASRDRGAAQARISTAAVLDMQHGGFDIATGGGGHRAAAPCRQAGPGPRPGRGFRHCVPHARRRRGRHHRPDDQFGRGGPAACRLHQISAHRASGAGVRVASRLLSGGLDGPDYLGRANAMQLTLAMIETRAALDNVDAILAVEGIDGVFVGPSDLSIGLSRGTLDPASSEVDAALDRIAGKRQSRRASSPASSASPAFRPRPWWDGASHSTRSPRISCCYAPQPGQNWPRRGRMRLGRTWTRGSCNSSFLRFCPGAIRLAQARVALDAQISPVSRAAPAPASVPAGRTRDGVSGFPRDL